MGVEVCITVEAIDGSDVWAMMEDMVEETVNCVGAPPLPRVRMNIDSTAATGRPSKRIVEAWLICALPTVPIIIRTDKARERWQEEKLWVLVHSAQKPPHCTIGAMQHSDASVVDHASCRSYRASIVYARLCAAPGTSGASKDRRSRTSGIMRGHMFSTLDWMAAPVVRLDR